MAVAKGRLLYRLAFAELMSCIRRPRFFRFVFVFCAVGCFTGYGLSFCYNPQNDKLKTISEKFFLRFSSADFYHISKRIYEHVTERYDELGQLDVGEEHFTVMPNVFAQIGVLDAEGVRKLWNSVIIPQLCTCADCGAFTNRAGYPLNKVEENIVFCDIGSGVGNVCLQVLAETNCKKVVGVEVIPSRHKNATTAFAKANLYYPEHFSGKDAVFINEDFVSCSSRLAEEQVNVIFTHSWMFDDVLMKKLTDVIISIPSVFCVITSQKLDKIALACSQLKLVSKVFLSADWNNEAPFYVYTKSYRLDTENNYRLLEDGVRTNGLFLFNDNSQQGSDEFSYEEDDVNVTSQFIDLAKDIMKRLLRVQKQMRTFKQTIETLLSSISFATEPVRINTEIDTANILTLLPQYDELQFFLWGRMARLLHEEHQHCSDVFADSLNLHDRLPFESLTHAIHHNTSFCDYMGEVISATINRDIFCLNNDNEPLQQVLVQHVKYLERTQILATYSALLVVEGSRESFLDPLSMYDLCRVVVGEKSRRKRLLALSLSFSMLEQDEQAISEAFNQELPQVLLMRMRHLVHCIFGKPKKHSITTDRECRVSSLHHYSAVIHSNSNSPLSSRKPSPDINNGSLLMTDKCADSSHLLRRERAQKSGQFSETMVDGSIHADQRQQQEQQGEDTFASFRDSEQIGYRRTRSENSYCDTEKHQKPVKIRRTERNGQEINSQMEIANWQPQRGEKVGRGPAWCFENQGEGSDAGEIVEITTTGELLVQWRKSIDSPADNDTNKRIFRYKYKRPFVQVVPWSIFFDIKAMGPESIDFKLEEFMLNCALVGALCHQRETVLSALQFQAIETMIHVLDSVDLADVMAVALKVNRLAEERERTSMAIEGEEGTVDEDALEVHLHWDSTLRMAKERYRQTREIIARVGWVLNALLSHKKLALIFLELDGLRQLMRLINVNLGVSTRYGCCIVLAQLARGAVFEKLLRSYGEYFEPIMNFILDQWKGASCHDVQGSAGSFLFQALSFPCVMSFFDAHQGPNATMATIEQLLNASEEQFDIVNPALTLVALKCFYIYLVSHLMLYTRVAFRKHRFLSASVTNSSPGMSLPRDPATVEWVLSLLSSSSSVSLPDVSIETVQSLMTRERLVAFRYLVDSNFHQLLLRCAQFYFAQSRWELLAASLNVLSVLAVVPFVRPLIADMQYTESGIAHLITIVSDLPVAFHNGNTSRELHLIPCVATALQILCYLTVPPVDKNDEAAVSTFNQACSMIRASDGVRTLLEVLRIRKDAAMSAKLHFFPVVARALQLMVTLRRYADTHLLFDALGMRSVAREVLTQYEDVQKEYISMLGPRYASGEVHATGRFMENVKCFLLDETNQMTSTVSVDPVEMEQRQAIIARSHITYSRESLLELIARHLENDGLQNVALALRRDAHLSSDSPSFSQSNNITTDVAALSAMAVPTLDGIVRSYLRQQHERCTNPIATLPQFDLRKSHVYYPSASPVDYTRNAFNRRLAQKMGVDLSLRMRANENHLIYRYPGHLFDITGGDGGLQGDSVAFCDNGDTLIVGTSEGAIAFFNTFPDDLSGEKMLDQHVVFDSDGVSGIFVSGDGAMMAVVSADHAVAVMKRDELPVIKYRVEHARAAQFSSYNTHLLTTCDEQHTCRLYDISTQREVRHFSGTSRAGENMYNVATFDSSSQLILSDAVLWDIRCNDKPIYRFDRFTDTFCNIFHPFNPLVLIDEKVWDLRTLTMLQTVPVFKGTSSFHSSQYARVIYSFREASDITNTTSSILSVVESSTFDTVFSTEVYPSFKAFAVDPSDRYCAAIIEQDVEALVRVFLTSSGPLPGQQSFPLPHGAGRDESDAVIGESEEEELVNDSFWSSTDAENDTGDDDDDDDDGDISYSSDTGGEEESEESSFVTASSTESRQTLDDVESRGSALTEEDEADFTVSEEATEETEDSIDASINST